MEEYSGLTNNNMEEILGNIEGIEEIPFDYEKEGNEDEYGEEEDVDEYVEEEEVVEEYVAEENDEGVDEDGLSYEDSPIDGEGTMISVDNVDDIGNLDLANLGAHQIVNIDFGSLEVALLLYRLYARVKGFAVRKSKIHRSKNGEIVQQAFVCNRQGFREDIELSGKQRQRKARLQTRCGCEAQFKVHIDKESMRWHATYFNDEHNHRMLEAKYVGMLPAFRKMGESDIMEMNYFRNAGIPPYLMYGSFACQSGGYENIGFSQKIIYNQIGKERRKHESDAKSCLEFLCGLGTSDPMMFVSHTVDEKGRMQHLFWSDGVSQNDYKIFGDVLAFDATYGKNKYRCPVVLFSGVNHHNQTVVFAAAIIANEREETYIWLLSELMKVMKGKTPSAVITDGDAAMRNAIKIVFPSAHHRLCAWHLSRNANTNVSIPEFTSQFTLCMLGDMGVGEFNKMWNDMVKKFGLHDNGWVAQIYEKRKMWAVAYMRGKFFGGLRTTSRCEGLHAQIGRYVKSRYSLTEFVHHFSRCLNHMRFKEHEADFASQYGEPVLETEFQKLEHSGSLVYTRDVFAIYCRVLSKSALMSVIGCRDVSNYKMFTVQRNGVADKKVFVSFYPSSFEFKCACQKMESIGIPCEHILVVLNYMHVGKLPRSLVLDRWTKFAKDSLVGTTNGGMSSWTSQMICRYAVLMQQYRDLAVLACKTFEYFCNEREKNRISIEDYRCKVDLLDPDDGCASGSVGPNLRDPARATSRGKGCLGSSSSGLKTRRKIKCSFCKLEGHNKKSCKTFRNYSGTMESQAGTQMPWAEEETTFNNEDYYVQILNHVDFGL